MATLNRLELFNEICILGVGYHLLLFTDFVPEPEIKYSIGWSAIVLSSLNIVVNLVMILIQTVQLIAAVVKKQIKRYRQRKSEKD